MQRAHFTRKNISTKKAFTLVELMVSVGIMTLVTAIILVNYRKFGSTVILQNLAYDIGLNIRKAQSYGIGVQGLTPNNPGTQGFTYPVGIHFRTNTAERYNIFADGSHPSFPTPNGLYDGAANRCMDQRNTECVEAYILQGRYRIKAICTSYNVSTKVCNTSPVINRVDITFTRPNPDAQIRITQGSIVTVINTWVAIEVHSLNEPNTFKKIIVYPTGQISIKDQSQL